jgi:hypothetical protein
MPARAIDRVIPKNRRASTSFLLAKTTDQKIEALWQCGVPGDLYFFGIRFS